VAAVPALEDEMVWHHSLSQRPYLYWLSNHYRQVRLTTFRLIFVANFLLFLSYPWEPADGQDGAWVAVVRRERRRTR